MTLQTEAVMLEKDCHPLVELNYLVESSNYLDTKFFILVDENTYLHCLPVLLEQIQTLRRATIIKIDSGEQNKTIETCIKIWEHLTANHADNTSLFFNLGGGVINDIGGFVAATYKRGVHFINIPTTLTAMADASIGGKTGVDFNSIKNMIGLFAQPMGIYLYPPFLKTLNKRQVMSGFAELLKHGLIADKGYWESLIRIKNPAEEDMTDLIYHSIRIKQGIVNEDRLDKGKRHVLNFGHTIGHALESYSMKHDENQITHGEAIATGIIIEAFLAHQIGKLNSSDMHLIQKGIITLFGKPYPITNEDVPVLMELMSQDKKIHRGNISIPILTGIGQSPLIISIQKDTIEVALKEYILIQHELIN